MKRSCAAPLLACLLAALPPAGAQPSSAGAAQATQAGANAARLQLRWALDEGDRTRARFTLVNGDARPLPAQGWALYFNCMEGVVPEVLPARLVLERVGGGLFRLRPAPGFAGVAAGGSLDIAYRYPSPQVKLANVPAGPYLVYDAAPDVGTAIGDYRQAAVTAAAPGTPGAATPQDTYRRNALADALPASALPLVLPTPLRLEAGPGRLALRARPAIRALPALENEAALADALFPPSLAAGGPPLTLAVGKVEGQASPEAYSLRIGTESGIAIVGNSAAGVFYGLQTLRDLLPLPGSADMSLPELAIVDAPRFGYRGFQLDVARNFHGKETVFKWLDLMARYKLNAFHFHLTDDEGWRLEIAGLPELTDVGAVRGHAARAGLRLQPAYGSGPDPTDPSGSGFYTRADYIAILRYAAARHIAVIPELEMPGHARAARQAMEARYERLRAAGDKDAAAYRLADPADRSVYRSPQAYGDHVIDPGLDSSFAFIDRVVGEVAAMHRAAGVPLRTIHMGGDELPAGAWEASPASLARMRAEGLAGSADLWDYFYDRVDGIVRRHGAATSGWEELASRRTQVQGESKLVPNPRFTKRGFTAWVWNNTRGAEDLAYRLANRGYDIVLAPVTSMYMDMAHNANPDEPGVNWGGYVELSTVYDFRPLDMLAPGFEGLSADGRRHVRGLEATLFTETVRDPERNDYLVMPRLLALAERAWAPDPALATDNDPAAAAAVHRAAWSGFVNALGQRVLPRLDLDGSHVAYRIAPPGMLVEGGALLVNHVLPGMVLRYTVDGEPPSAASPLVAGPIRAHGLVQAAAFDRNGRRGQVARLKW